MKTLPNHHFNPIGHLVLLAKFENPEVIDKARAIALILCPEPPTASGDGVFFRQQARDWLTWWLVYLAWWESITGELVCNLPALYERVFDGLAEIEGFLAEMRCCAVFEGTVRKAANRILGRFARASKTAESILSECQNALQIYDPASKLAQSMVLSEFNPSDLKNLIHQRRCSSLYHRRKQALTALGPGCASIRLWMPEFLKIGFSLASLLSEMNGRILANRLYHQ